MFGTGFARPGRFLKLYAAAATTPAINRVGEIRVNPISDIIMHEMSVRGWVRPSFLSKMHGRTGIA